jgi:Flp pilus assembly pilin Flp
MRRRRERDDRGATAVEFGLIVIPFLVLVLGMIQYGWYFYVSQTTGGAASNVVRQLQVGDCWADGEALSRAQEQAPMVNDLDKLPDTDDPTTLNAGDPIEITLTADAEIIGLIPMPNGGQIVKTVEARLEDTEEGPDGC